MLRLLKMAADISTFGTISITSVVAAVIVAVILYIGFKSKREKEEVSDANKSEIKDKPRNEKKREKLKQTKGRRCTVPDKAHHRQFAVLKGHASHVFDVEFSLNGKYLASTSQGYRFENG